MITSVGAPSFGLCFATDVNTFSLSMVNSLLGEPHSLSFLSFLLIMRYEPYELFTPHTPNKKKKKTKIHHHHQKKPTNPPKPLEKTGKAYEDQNLISVLLNILVALFVDSPHCFQWSNLSFVFSSLLQFASEVFSMWWWFWKCCVKIWAKWWIL